MNCFELIAHRSLIFFVLYHSGKCEELEYALKLDLAQVEGRQEEWESVLLSKYKNSETFTFNNEQLKQICGGAFTSSDVEIVEVFNRAMRFSLIRKTNEPNDQLFINVIFSKKDSVDVFFEDIDSNSQEEHEQESRPAVHLEKLYQYQIMETEHAQEPLLKLLDYHVVFYTKNLSPDWFVNPRTSNFTRGGSDDRFRGVLLVLLAKTFNISKEVGRNNYVLCSANVPTHRFILRFARAYYARNFFKLIQDDLNDEIPCLTNWVSRHIVEAVNYKIYTGHASGDPYQLEADPPKASHQ